MSVSSFITYAYNLIPVPFAFNTFAIANNFVVFHERFVKYISRIIRVLSFINYNYYDFTVKMNYSLSVSENKLTILQPLPYNLQGSFLMYYNSASGMAKI